MKEERKEKIIKSHTGRAGWSTGLLCYRKPATRTAYALGATLRYAGRAAGADSPRGSRVPDSVVSPLPAQGTLAWGEKGPPV